jgi:AcrR family transcriptional regulator
MAVTSTVRWRRRKEARPNEIYTAALACFAERGFAATRLEDVAQRAGVSKGTLYLYVSSKDELFKAVVRETLLPKLALLESQVDLEGSAAATLGLLIRAWVDVIQNSPLSALPKVVLSESGNFPDLARFYLREVVHRAQRLIGGIVARGIAQGEFREVAVEHATMTLIAPMVFLMLWKQSLGRFQRPPMDIAALSQTLLDINLHGLLAGNAPQPPGSKPRRRAAQPVSGRAKTRRTSSRRPSK